MKFERFLRSTAFGCLCGWTLANLFAWTIDAELREGYERNLTYLITAGVSLFAAMLTLYGVLANNENQNSLAEKAKRRKFLAARAVLPTALSKIMKVSRVGMSQSMELQDIVVDPDKVEASIQNLELSPETISVLQVIIETVDDDKIANQISGLLREYQVFCARWDSRVRTKSDTIVEIDANHRQRLVSWAYLGAIASTLFEFARNEAAEPKDEDIGEIMRSIIHSSSLGLWADDYSEEFALYERTYRHRFKGGA